MCREFTSAHIEFLANIARLYRGEAIENDFDSESMLLEQSLEREYVDVAGLCKVTTIAEIEAQEWNLNPGRCVSVAQKAPEEFVFLERLEELNEALETLI